MKRFVNFSPDPLANRNVNFQYAACSSQEKCKARAGGGSTGGGGEVDARWRRGGWRTRRRRLALALARSDTTEDPKRTSQIASTEKIAQEKFFFSEPRKKWVYSGN